MRTFLKILGWLVVVIVFVTGIVALVTGLIRFGSTPKNTSRHQNEAVVGEAEPIRKEISAGLDWQDTKIFIPAGSTLIIEQRSGMWSECAPYGCPYKDANGNPDSSPNQDNNLMQGCLHASLIGRVSTSWFCVGSSHESQIQETGYLYLRINDSFLEDNDGTIVVNILVK